MKLCVLIENYALTQIKWEFKKSRVSCADESLQRIVSHLMWCLIYCISGGAVGSRLGTCFTRFLSVYTRPSPLSNGIMGREVRLIMTGAMLNVNRWWQMNRSLSPFNMSNGTWQISCYILPLPICRSSASPRPGCAIEDLSNRRALVRATTRPIDWRVTHSVVSCSRMFRRRHHSLLSCQLSASRRPRRRAQTNIDICFSWTGACAASPSRQLWGPGGRRSRRNRGE